MRSKGMRKMSRRHQQPETVRSLGVTFMCITVWYAYRSQYSVSKYFMLNDFTAEVQASQSNPTTEQPKLSCWLQDFTTNYQFYVVYQGSNSKHWGESQNMIDATDDHSVRNGLLANCPLQLMDHWLNTQIQKIELLSMRTTRSCWSDLRREPE